MKRVMIILSMVFGILFLGFSFSEASPEKRYSVNQVETEFLEKNIPYLKSQLNIPVVAIPGNTELANKLNKGFKEEALSFRNQVELEAKKAYEELTKAGVSVSPYEAISKYEVHNLKDYLSLTITYYQYTGGAHGISQVISHNYDLASGKRLELKDVFKKDYNYQEVINKFIKEAIAQKPEEFFPDAFQGIGENQNFYIGKEGITIYFQNYEIAPYVAGNPEFLIPYSVLREGLNINIQ